MLVDKGADINAQDHGGLTPLMYTAGAIDNVDQSRRLVLGPRVRVRPVRKQQGHDIWMIKSIHQSSGSALILSIYRRTRL